MEQPLMSLMMDEYDKAVEAHRRHGAPRVSDLFKIPPGIDQKWSDFFGKVLGHLERECAVHEHTLLLFEARYERMSSIPVGEFDMLESARQARKMGNEAYRRGKFREAELFYGSALNLFPTSDTMNNYAACALKLNEFNDARRYATMALETGLLTSHASIAKAYMRRAEAHLVKANFEDALEDASYALTLNVPIIQSSAKELIVKVQGLISSIDSPSKRNKYLAMVPHPFPKTTIDERMRFAKIHGLGIVHLSEWERAEMRAQNAPVF